MRFDRIKLYSGNRFLRALEWTTLNISNDTKSFTNFEPFFKKKFLKMSINWCQDVYRLVLTRPHKLIESFSSVLYSSFSNSYIFFLLRKKAETEKVRESSITLQYNTRFLFGFQQCFILSFFSSTNRIKWTIQNVHNT